MNTRGIALGVDVATAHVRVVALDPGSSDPWIGPVEVALAQPQRDANGGVSQKADYGEAVMRALGGLVLLLGAQRAAGVDSLCVTATSGTLVPTNDQGAPVGDALMYNDNRAPATVAERAMLRVPDRPYPSIGRIWWIAHHSTATQILSPADVVLAFLAGGTVLPADTSHHLKSGIDPRGLTWPAALLEDLGISTSLMPTLCAPGEIIGTMAPGVASELGLPAGLSLVSGMTDGCTSQIATGGIALGDTVGVLGTTLVVKATSYEEVTDSEKGVYSHYSPDQLFLPGGASNIGLGSFDALGYKDRESLHQDIERAGSATFASIVHYPLPSTGERFPFHSPAATSLRSGEPHSALDEVRAIMEGIGFAERLGLAMISGTSAAPKRHHLSGGGSTSRAWNTLRATILGAPVLLPRLRDSAIGAAIIALAATENSRLWDIATEVLPEPALIDPVFSEIEQATDRWGEFLDLLNQAGYLDNVAGL